MTDNRPTPETDSYANRDWWTLFRANEHARELERQRDEAREERDKLKQLLAADSERVDAYLGVCVERDEAREKLKEQHEALLTLAEHGENEIQKLLKELAETRNKMADALQEVDLRTLDFERMKQELHAARATAARWEAIAFWEASANSSTKKELKQYDTQSIPSP